MEDESTHDLTVGVSSLVRTSSDSGKPTTSQSGFYQDKFKLLSVVLGPIRLKYKEPLKLHTFSKSPAKADCFYVATSKSELICALDTCLELQIPFFIIGSGTKILNEYLPGLVIKNRTSNIKISSVRGKVGVGGIDVDEAIIELDSGVTFDKLNQFLNEQKLLEFAYVDSLNATLGGSLNLNPNLKTITQKIKIWESGVVEFISIEDLNMRKQVILSIVIKVKAKKV